MSNRTDTLREFILVSDFDQTLSFKDSGHVLSELMGIPNLELTL
jgi:2-hydroxy-3-keto-5-methylthiopentenyl-1-phosphate phosphatase